MKKRLAIIMTCIIFITSLICVGATYQQDGYAVEFNGESTNYTSIFSNNTHYVPMRIVFEKMGASIFYRGKDS